METWFLVCWKAPILLPKKAWSVCILTTSELRSLSPRSMPALAVAFFVMCDSLTGVRWRKGFRVTEVWVGLGAGQPSRVGQLRPESWQEASLKSLGELRTQNSQEQSLKLGRSRGSKGNKHRDQGRFLSKRLQAFPQLPIHLIPLQWKRCGWGQERWGRSCGVEYA